MTIQDFYLTTSIILEGPNVIVLIGCIAVCIMRWNRLNKIAGLAFIGFGGLFVKSILFASLVEWLPRWLINNQVPSATMNSILIVVAGLSAILSAACYIVLATAIFSGRSTARQSSLHE